MLPSPTLRKRLFTVLLLIGCGSTLYGVLVRLSLVPGPTQLPATVLCLRDCLAAPSSHKIATRPAAITHTTSTSTLNHAQPLQTLLGEDIDTAKVSLLIEKSKYQLTVFYDSQPVKTYATVFGSAPTGDKLAEGDRKTPEGIYHVRDRYEHPAWSKFIWLDYPTPQDWREHTAAKLAGEISPQATIGSEIGIHGVPEGADGLIDAQNNWTWGCIALKNKNVDEIYQVITKGTLIEIVP